MLLLSLIACNLASNVQCGEPPSVPTCNRDASPRCRAALIEVDQWEALCGRAPATIVLGRPEEETLINPLRFTLPSTTVLDQEGQPIEPQPEVTWSKDPNGLISGEGLILGAHGSGVAKMEARSGQARATWTVTILRPDRLEIRGVPDHAGVGYAIPLQAMAYEKDSLLDVPVTWRSETPHLAVVSTDGVVTPLAAGEAQITAQVTGLLPTQVVLSIR